MYLQHPQGDFPRPPRARSPAGADQQLCVRVCAGQGRARLWQHGPGEREQQQREPFTDGGGEAVEPGGVAGGVVEVLRAFLI